MDTYALQSNLDQLHEALIKTKVMDRDFRDRLSQLMVDIEDFLDENEMTADFHRDNLISKIKAMKYDYEFSYPPLSRILGQIVDSLYRMCIS